MGLLCMDEYLDERISPVKLIYWPDEATQIPARRVLSALTMLEIENYVLQSPGKRYARNVVLSE